MKGSRAVSQADIVTGTRTEGLAGIGTATTSRILRSAGLILLAGLVSLGMSGLTSDVRLVLGLQIGGVMLVASTLLLLARHLLGRSGATHLHGTVARLIEHDPTPSYLTDADGTLQVCNAAARVRRGGDDPVPQTLIASLADLFANPGAVLFRLQARAQALGGGREDIVTRRGRFRLSVHQVGAAAFLWRLEDLTDGQGARGVDGVGLPMLTAGPSGTVLYMNEALRRMIGARVKSLDRMFTTLPLVSGRVYQVEGVDGPADCLLAIVSRTGGRQEIYLLPADAAAAARARPADWDAIEDLPVPLLKVAVTGEILASNREARDLLCAEIENGTRLSDLLEGLGRPIIDWLQEVGAGRGTGAAQFLRGTDDQQDVFVQVTLNPAGQGQSAHLIAVLNDVTALKSLEAQFVQSQKMQAIGQLAGGVAHDFNNLLTAISGHCDLLLLRHDPGDQDYSDLIQIHQNANRAASLVGQLLAFSRKQNLRPEVVDLRDTLADLTHLLNRLVGERVMLTLNHDPGLLPIRADKRQLEQVIMNLVVNARDAMPSGGEIKVETENLTLPEPIERDHASIPAGRYVLVKVIDEGHGIPPEKIGKIFEPFYTTKKTGEGTGLGLSTAYGIVKQTGGFIFVDSEVGVGTVFTLYLPVNNLPAEVPASQPPVIAVAVPNVLHGDGVVLLVEDEAPVRAFASRALRLRGYTVLEADSAEAALDMLADPELLVDLFVTDVIMPGKDGPTWVREALEQRPATKVVFVSGYAEDAFGEHQSLIPQSVFLPKPFSLAELTATVQRQLS